MRIRVLGCSGAIAKDCRTTSFLIDDDTLIDAGTGVGDLTLDIPQFLQLWKTGGDGLQAGIIRYA